jgi:hypothetical protein
VVVCAAQISRTTVCDGQPLNAQVPAMQSTSLVQRCRTRPTIKHGGGSRRVQCSIPQHDICVHMCLTRAVPQGALSTSTPPGFSRDKQSNLQQQQQQQSMSSHIYLLMQPRPAHYAHLPTPRLHVCLRAAPQCLLSCLAPSQRSPGSSR